MTNSLKEIIIPKDKAVFWLDKNGCWHNQHGKFQHKKIVEYFHASIRKDLNGYYLSQTIADYKEKVYFHYEDTALFAFDLIKGTDITPVLNTGSKIKLKPSKMVMQGDDLYMIVENERIKFIRQGLLKISDLIEHDGETYFVKVKNRRYPIQIQ
jgi:hypothetical protein